MRTERQYWSRLCAAALLGSVLISASSAQAQTGPIAAGDAYKGLTEGDLQLLFRATHTINHASLLRPGQVRSWSNPDSGAHGEVAFVRATQVEGIACHELRSTIFLPDAREPGIHDRNWCLTPIGDWRIQG